MLPRFGFGARATQTWRSRSERLLPTPFCRSSWRCSTSGSTPKIGRSGARESVCLWAKGACFFVCAHSRLELLYHCSTLLPACCLILLWGRDAALVQGLKRAFALWAVEAGCQPPNDSHSIMTPSHTPVKVRAFVCGLQIICHLPCLACLLASHIYHACFALLCFALLCFALLCFALLRFV